MAATFNPATMKFQRYLPNGVDFIGKINSHIVYNFLRDRPSDLRMPSVWREAYLVVHETSPLDMYTFDYVIDPTRSP